MYLAYLLFTEERLRFYHWRGRIANEPPRSSKSGNIKGVFRISCDFFCFLISHRKYLLANLWYANDKQKRRYQWYRERLSTTSQTQSIRFQADTSFLIRYHKRETISTFLTIRKQLYFFLTFFIRVFRAYIKLDNNLSDVSGKFLESHSNRRHCTEHFSTNFRTATMKFQTIRKFNAARDEQENIPSTVNEILLAKWRQRFKLNLIIR